MVDQNDRWLSESDMCLRGSGQVRAIGDQRVRWLTESDGWLRESNR
jgi:hypothetical protein